MHLIVNAGSMISSIEYNKAKDGKATIIKINEGRTVQTISSVVPWITVLAEPAKGEFFEKYWSVRIIAIKTKKKINVIKNIKS